MNDPVRAAFTSPTVEAMVRAPNRPVVLPRAVYETRVMASKFAEFLDKNKIDPRRILAASSELERLRPEDRAAKLARRKGKAKDAAAGGEEAAPKKPRSGRPVTPRALAAAQNGKPVPGPAKTRLVRAINHVLAQKKKEAVDLRALF